jgi:hypothetical protein
VTSILPPVKGMEKLTPARARDAQPPKWVQKEQAAAIQPENLPDPEPLDDFPFGDPALDDFGSHAEPEMKF